MKYKNNQIIKKYSKLFLSLKILRFCFNICGFEPNSKFRGRRLLQGKSN